MAKLEGLLERSVSSKDKARTSTGELDKLRKEIDFLQSQVRQTSFGQGREHSELERLRRETANLEALLRDLRAELKQREDTYQGEQQRDYGKAAGLGEFEDWEDERAYLDIDL